ncbi:Farnesylcysteine lyase [Linum grandiflorum]
MASHQLSVHHPSLVIIILCLLPFIASSSPSELDVCIVGSGIGGSSLSHFLRLYSADHSDESTLRIRMFERHAVVGGRMATVTIGGNTFEAGASILHPKNLHASNFTELLNLNRKLPSPGSMSLGIWDGGEFVFKTVTVASDVPIVQKIVSWANSLRIFLRYGFSLLKMESFVETTIDKFMKYYESTGERPIFESVDEMLKWAGLYDLTTKTLEDQLLHVGLSPLLIHELITVITRINYGQSSEISGLAGAVSLAGSGGGLWAVEGGNWQMAAGLINISKVELHLSERISSVSKFDDYYELNSTKGNSYACNVTVIASPLDELEIQFRPLVSIPERKLQHTYTTFVRGLLNPVYFGLKSVSDLPELVGTIEDPKIPFSSISVLKQHNETDATYKIFSRTEMSDALLNGLFSTIVDTIRLDWGAYPHYKAPEVFAPFILDDHHLYYINAFENAASTMETSAVAADNIARLILSRTIKKVSSSSSDLKLAFPDKGEVLLHPDL